MAEKTILPERPKVIAPGSWTGPYTTEGMKDWKPVFWLETEKAIYMANDLNTMLYLWRNSQDGSKALATGQIG